MILFVFGAVLAILFASFSHRYNNRSWLVASFGVIVFFMAFQDSISVDFSSYKKSYELICEGSLFPSLLFSQRDYGYSIEPGWWVLNRVLSFWGTYYAVSFCACSFLCYALYCILVKVPSKYYWFAIMYFYFSAMLFYMSGIRQGVAVAFFIFTCLNLREKKYLQATILFFLGCTFHNTMLYSSVFIPILFINKIESKKVQYYICAIISVAYLVFFVYSKELQSFILMYTSDILKSSDMYANYLEEISVSEFSINNILSKSFIFIFTLYAFFRSERFAKYALMCFLVSQLGDVLLGFTGSLARVFLYIKVFGLPVMAFIPTTIKSDIFRAMFILGLLFVVIWQFYNKVMTSEQFMNFLDYKTIFF